MTNDTPFVIALTIWGTTCICYVDPERSPLMPLPPPLSRVVCRLAVNDVVKDGQGRLYRMDFDGAHRLCPPRVCKIGIG